MCKYTLIKDYFRTDTKSPTYSFNLPAFFIIPLLFLFSWINAPLAYSEGFKVVKVNSHFEPELVTNTGIILPGTNIQAGYYTYILDVIPNEVTRLGFLFGNEQFFFVQSTEYNLSGDINYGVYNNYFLIDSWGYGSGHNRLMFLFKYDRDSIRLLDVIGPAYVNTLKMDFMSSYKDNGNCATTSCPPRVMILEDVNKDGNPEIKLNIPLEHQFGPFSFELYIELAHDRIQVNLNPELYKPLFEREKKNTVSNEKSLAYYIYGFLAQRLDMKQIKSSLKNKKEQYEVVLTLLGKSERWDTEFHAVNGEKFILKQYNYKRR